MNKIISLFLTIFPLFYFSQKENVTTSQASYPVTETKEYKKGSKKNNNTIFFEVHPEQKIPKLFNERCYLEKNADYFTAYIINDNDFCFELTLQDGDLFIIQEAQNRNGEWIPIEHWIYSDCGNSYDNSLILAPKTYASFPIKIQKGDFKTKIRLKMKDLRSKNIYYSKSFEGMIDQSAFKNPDWKKPDHGYSHLSYFDEK
jgi:hypothetical protein